MGSVRSIVQAMCMYSFLPPFTAVSLRHPILRRATLTRFVDCTTVRCTSNARYLRSCPAHKQHAGAHVSRHPGSQLDSHPADQVCDDALPNIPAQFTQRATSTAPPPSSNPKTQHLPALPIQSTSFTSSAGNEQAPSAGCRATGRRAGRRLPRSASCRPLAGFLPV